MKAYGPLLDVTCEAYAHVNTKSNLKGAKLPALLLLPQVKSPNFLKKC